MKAYPMALRTRFPEDCDAGMGTQAVAEKYRVSPAWVRRLKQHRRERGDIRPRTGGPRPRVIDRSQLARLVEAYPDATLREYRQRLGIECSLSAVCMVLRELKLTFKKRQSMPRNRIDRTSL